MTYGTGAAGGNSLKLLLRSSVVCRDHELQVPLGQFDQFVWVDRQLLAQRIQQVIALMDIDVLREALAMIDGAVQLDLDNAEWPVLRLADALAGDETSGALLNWTSAGGGHIDHPTVIERLRSSGQLDVCMSGVVVRSMESAPPNALSTMCTATWSLLDHAAALQAQLSKRASCDAEGALSVLAEIHSLVDHRDRLAGLAPSQWTRSCLQAYEALTGTRYAISLPAHALANNLNELYRALHAIEAVWNEERLQSKEPHEAQAEVVALAAHAVGMLRDLAQWEPRARAVPAELHQLSGILIADSALNPSKAIGQVQALSSALRRVSSEQLEAAGLPDVAYELKMLQIEMTELLPYLDRVGIALDGVESLIGGIVAAISEALEAARRLHPEAAFGALGEADLDAVDLAQVQHFFDAMAAFVGRIDGQLISMPGHQQVVSAASCELAGDQCHVQSATSTLEGVAEQVGRKRRLHACRPACVGMRPAWCTHPARIPYAPDR